MERLVLIVGKSSSGKDTIGKKLLECTESRSYEMLTPCTTRPMRDEESELNPYHFIKDEQVDNEMIAKTSFKTNHGIWYYGFVNETLDLNKNYIAIVNPGQIEELYKRHSETHRIFLVFIEAKDEEERIVQAIKREERNKKDYKELCRRFVADSEDFKDCHNPYSENEIWRKVNGYEIVDDILYITNDYKETPENIALVIDRKLY